MPRKSFEELALAYRAQSRERYAGALAAERGPMPYGKTLSEQQQDEMWAHADQRYVDPPEVTAAVAEAVQQAQQGAVTQAERDAAVQQAIALLAQQLPQSAFLRLMLPKEAGGQGMTPLQASYVKYPHRQLLVEGAGREIEKQVEYANGRQKRMQQGVPATTDGGQADTAQQPPASGGY